MRVTAPDQKGNDQQRINEQSITRFPTLELDLRKSDDGSTIYIEPQRGFKGSRKTRFLLNQKGYEEDGTSVSLATTGLGGMVDGNVKAASTYYLIWAFANAANTAIEGYGITRKPLADVSSISGGTEGSTITLTLSGSGVNDAYQFSVDGYVILRNTSGSSPNYQFNQGYITAIPNNTTITVQLFSGIPGASNITSATGLEVEQISHFTPWDGDTTGDRALEYDNFRLIGECATNLSSNLIWTRRATDTERQIDIEYAAVVSAINVTTIYYLYRYIPFWSEAIGITYYGYEDSGGLMVARGLIDQLNFAARILAGISNNTIFPEYVYGDFPVSDGIFSIFLFKSSGTGDMRSAPFLQKYIDGGIR